MRISTAKEKLKEILQNTNIVPALIGERGIGKTEILKQIANELGWGYQAIYPSSLEGPDFMGLVVKDLELGITRYLAPEFLPVEKAVEKGIFPENGLLVIEEFNRAEMQTIHTLYPLLLERKINTHKIHDGWKIAVAMNPDNMVYTTVSIDIAALDRLLILPIEPHIEDYIDYSISTNMYDRDVLDYLTTYPQMLLVNNEDNTDAMEKNPCPRAWTRLQELKSKTRICNDNNLIDIEIIAGLIGNKTATSFLGYIRNREFKPIAVNDILKNINGAIKQLQAILEKNRYDIINITLRELIYNIPTKKKQIEQIEEFILNLPEELQVMFIKLLYDKRKSDYIKILQSWNRFGQKALEKIVDVAKEN